MRWAGHIACTYNGKYYILNVLVGKYERKRPFGNLDVNMRIILK
jgi:hypothetical protein